MKNKLIVILIILISILAIVIYAVINYRNSFIKLQKINNEYKELYNKSFCGTDLVSIMNKTVDINEKRGILKDSDNLYIDNEKDTIIIFVKLKYKDDYKTFRMEKIINDGMENFIKSYSVADFKCTDINCHNRTRNVKELTFTEI